MLNEMLNLDFTKDMKSRWKMYETLLCKKGVPRGTLDKMRIDMTYDAVTQAESIMYDRIYSAVALMLRKTLNFGSERIMKCLHGLDDVIGSTMTDEGKGNTGWAELMQELKDETGIVISSGNDGRLFAEISRK